MVLSCTHYLSPALGCSDPSALALEAFVPAMPIERSDGFYVESLFILVQDTVFNVPRYYFELTSDSIFMTSPLTWGWRGTGWSEDMPVVLTGFTAKEFGVFLMFKFGDLCATYEAKPLNTLNGWEPILKVATVLGFKKERRSAIKAMSALFGSDEKTWNLKKIYLGRAYQVEEWLLSAYTKLAKRVATLDDDEVEVLGFRIAVVVFRMRDRGFSPTRPVEAILGEEVKNELLTCETGTLQTSQVEGICDTVKVQRFHDACCLQYTTVKVENKLFRVFVRVLTSQSVVFQDLVKLHWAAGKSGEQPLVLEGVSHEEFAVLLHAIWPLKHPSASTRNMVQSSEYWLTVLKLSTMWQFNKIRSRAIEQLSGAFGSLKEGMDMGKVILARKYNVPRWLMEAYLSIANREAGITAAEREILGWETAFGLMELRDVNIRAKKKTSKSHRDDCWLVITVALEEVEAKFAGK